MPSGSGEAALSQGHPDETERGGAVRLIFSYEGDDLRLVSRQRLEMVPPPSDPLEGFEGQKGFWVEVRDADGAVLHRQIMHAPIRRDAEVFSDDPERSIARIPVERPSGAFAVLIPELPEADHVALVSSPATEKPEATPAAETHRFSLTEAPEQRENGE